MTKKKSTKRVNKKVNMFLEGGEAITSGIAGATNLASMGIYNSKLKDTTALDSEIDKLENFRFKATDKDSLLAGWRSFNPMDTVQNDQLLGKDNTWKIIGSGAGAGAVTGAAIGAATGAGVFSPITTAAGAAIGTVAGAITGVVSREKAEKKALEESNAFNERIKEGNESIYNSMIQQARNLNTQDSLMDLANYSAFGGNIRSKVPNLFQHGGDFSNGVTVIGNGGTHESNPMQGVPMGVDPEGVPNLVEEGEVKYENYIYSNRLQIPNELRKQYKLRGTTFAEAAKELQKESSERPNDPISRRGLQNSMDLLRQAQEAFKQQSKKANNKMPNMFAFGDELNTPYFDYISAYDNLYTDNITSTPDTSVSQTPKSPTDSSTSDDAGINMKNWNSYLRYAPALVSGISSLTDAFGWTNKPNYTNAERVENSGRILRDVSASPIGNYLTYKPLDRNYYTNKLNAQSGATRRDIINQSGGNRATAMAGLLAADYNAQSQLGDLARQAEEYNLNQRMQVEQFNRGTNQFNSQQALQADIANQGNDRARMQAAIQGAQMREQISGISDAAKSSNMNNFIESLGDIGREQFARNMITSNPANYYTIDSQGNIKYKEGYEELSEQEKKAVQAHAKGNANKKAKGGYLTIRKKK